MVSTPKPTNQQQQRFRLIFDKLKFLLVHFFSPLLFLLNSFFHGKNKSEVDLGMGKICYNPSRNAAAAATPPEPAWIRCLKRGEEMDAGDQGEAHKGRKLEHRPTNNQLHTHTQTQPQTRALCPTVTWRRSFPDKAAGGCESPNSTGFCEAACSV